MLFTSGGHRVQHGSWLILAFHRTKSEEQFTHSIGKFTHREMGLGLNRDSVEIKEELSKILGLLHSE